jgi:hypothetical protein
MMKKWVSTLKEKLNRMINFVNSQKKVFVYLKLLVLILLLEVFDWLKKRELVSNNRIYNKFNSNCTPKPTNLNSETNSDLLNSPNSDCLFSRAEVSVDRECKHLFYNCLYSYDEESHGNYEE